MLSHRQLFLNHLAQTSSSPLALEIERAEGIYLYDISGKRYMDLISGISVSNIGHRHPAVLEAIKSQLDKYLHLMVYGEYIQSPQVLLAKALCDLLPPKLESVYFTNSGSEAIEGAMKLAKRYSGRSEVISFSNAYHGSTQGSLSIMGNEEFKNSFRPLLPGIKILPFNVIDELSSITEKTACVFAETIQGEAGVIVPDLTFMQKLRERCNETGALLILDEIQCGFGRTGKLFAFENYNIFPDILCLAKGMGGGMPIGAFISSKVIMNSFISNPALGHITTFGGHPVNCAAALATLEVLQNQGLMEKVISKELLFRKMLKHPKIKEVRGKGLLLAISFEDFDTNKKVIDKALSRGLITDWFLFNSSSMRIAPPLTITENEICEACEIILDSI